MLLLSPKSIYPEEIENQYEVSEGLSKEGPVTVLLIEIKYM